MTSSLRKAWRHSQGAALRRGDKALEPWAEATRALDILRSFEPQAKEQAQTRARMQEFIAQHPSDAHLRTLPIGHLTASALVVDPVRNQALLTHHRKLDRWLQLGGHADGDANLVAVALREACEESGLDDLCILPRPIDLDVHLIPARAGEPAHLHWDTRFLIFAQPGSVEVASAESHQLAWVGPAQVHALTREESVVRLFRAVFQE